MASEPVINPFIQGPKTMIYGKSGNVADVDSSGNLLTTGGGGGGGTVAQGAPNASLANGWPVKVTDGTSVLGTASAPLRTDPTGTTVQPVTTPKSSTVGACASTAVTSSSSQILAANASRKEVIITNKDVVTVYIGLGQTPTATAYHASLSPCAVANDGTGGVFISDLFTGAINAIVASTAGSVVIAELT